MPGFFTAAETKAAPIKPLREGCGGCGLYKNAISPKMGVYGKGEKGIMVLAEAPGNTEDRTGKLMVGKSGRLMKRLMDSVGINLERDCWKMNACSCCPRDEEGKSRGPADTEIEACRPRVMRMIDKFKPRIIIAAGASAVSSIVSDRFHGGGGINLWRGYTIPDRELNAWIVPVYHPAHVLRTRDKEPVMETLLRNDLKNARRCMSRDFPQWHDEISDVNILTKQEDIDHHLNRLMLQEPLTAFDWEATGLRPYGPKHKLISVAFATMDGQAFSFLIPRKRQERLLLRRALVSMELGKIAYNMAFENMWSVHALGVEPYPWVWDPQLAAHFEDNRKRSKSLKFQTYVHYGVTDYDSHMKEWLVPDPERKKKDGANALNRLPQLIRSESGIRDVLTYNGLDSIYTMKHALRQMENMKVEIPQPWTM